jgi:hypothetical protein
MFNNLHSLPWQGDLCYYNTIIEFVRAELPFGVRFVCHVGLATTTTDLLVGHTPRNRTPHFTSLISKENFTEIMRVGTGHAVAILQAGEYGRRDPSR